MKEWIPIANQNIDWITGVLLVNLLLLAYVKRRYELQFFSFIRFIDTTTYIKSYSEKYGIFSGFISLSMLFSCFTISLFSLFFLSHYYAVDLSFTLFVYVIVGLLLTVLLRSYLILFLSNLLGAKNIIQSFQFRNCTYIFRLSIFLYICLVFYHYGWNQSLLLFQFMVWGGVLIYFTSQILILRQLFDAINRAGVYFILYLCTLKMSPWILLFNGIKQLYV